MRLKQEQGMALVEYGLVAACIAILVLIAVSFFGEKWGQKQDKGSSTEAAILIPAQ